MKPEINKEPPMVLTYSDKENNNAAPTMRKAVATLRVFLAGIICIMLNGVTGILSEEAKGRPLARPGQ